MNDPAPVPSTGAGFFLKSLFPMLKCGPYETPTEHEHLRQPLQEPAAAARGAACQSGTGRDRSPVYRGNTEATTIDDGDAGVESKGSTESNEGTEGDEEEREE